MSVNAEMASLYDSEGIANGGTLTWADIGGRYGVSGNAARKRVKRHKSSVKSGSDDAKTTWEQRGKNEAFGESTFDFYANIDDLVERLRVDTKVWEVAQWGYSSRESNWEGYAKVGTTKVINYEDGKQTGYVTDEKLETIPMHGESCKIWATFRRIEPLLLFPTIQPVECKVTYSKPPAPSNGDIVRMLAICDPHIGFRKRSYDALLVPFHDRAVLDLALQIAIYAEVGRIDFLGDVLDMNDWSDKFTKEPEFRDTTQPAIEEGYWWLRQFREALPQTIIEQHEGNHEDRMGRAVKNHLPAAHGLRRADSKVETDALSIPNLMALDALAIEWRGNYPQDLQWLNGRLAKFHGDTTRNVPGGTARAIADKIRAIVVFGHSHTQEIVTLNWQIATGQIVGTGFCPGCACHTDGRVPGDDGRSNWQKGLGIIEYEIGSDMVGLTPLLIENNSLIYNGRRFTARDRLADLRRDNPKWNWGA